MDLDSKFPPSVDSPPEDGGGQDQNQGQDRDQGQDRELESLNWTGSQTTDQTTDQDQTQTQAIDMDDDPFGGATTRVEPPVRNKGGRPKGSKTKRRAVTPGRGPGGREVKTGPGQPARGSGAARVRQSHRDYEESGAFPLPKTRHFKDDNARAEIRVPAFFEFWKHASESGFSRRIMVYVYRVWPVMMEGHRQAGKLTEPITAEDLLRMYGVGDYNIKLNDAGNGYATVCQCTVRNVGDRNLTEHPPVLDPEGLDHTDPLNQSYVKFLASRGELRKEGDDDMAGVEVVRELTGTVRDLTDRVLNEREDNRGRRAFDPESQAALKGMEIVQQAAMRGQEMLDQSLKRSQEINHQQGDPIAVLERATKLVRDIVPMGGGGGGGSDSADKIVEVMGMMMNRDKEYYDRLFLMQSQQITELKEALTRTQTQSQTQALDNRPKTMLEQISEFAAVRDKMRDMLGIEDGDSKSAGGGWTDHIPAILQGLTMLGAVIVNAAYNISVARTGQGTPIAPPNPDAVMTPDQAQAVQAGHMAAQPPGYGQPVQQGQQSQNQPHYPSQFAAEQAEAALNQIKASGGLQTMTQFHAFLQMIEVPLLKSFQDGESGSDFAAKLIELGDNGLFGRETTGQQIYDMVTQYGLMMVGTVIKTYNPIWRVVSMTPGKWDTFLAAFFNAPSIWEQEDAEDAEDQAIREREEQARAAQSQVRRVPKQAGTSPGPVPVQTPSQTTPQTSPQTTPHPVAQPGPQNSPGEAGVASGSVSSVQGSPAPGRPQSAPKTPQR